MRLLFVSEYFTPKEMGGGEINLRLLAKKLAKEGVEVSILTSYFTGLKKVEEIDGIKVYRTLTTGDDPSSVKSNITRSLIFPHSIVKEIKKLTKKQSFDAIHFIGLSILAAPRLNFLKIPLFSTIESYPALCPKGDRIFHAKKECKLKCSFSRFVVCQRYSAEIGKMRNKIYLKYNPLFLTYLFWYHKKLQNSLRFCKLIAISEYIQKILLQHGQESAVIPNAVEIKKFQLVKDKRKSKKGKILYLGSLTKYKGPQVLLEAMKGLNYSCNLYGEGPLKSQLLDVINKNNLDANIHPFVPYEKVPQLYSDTDLVVFPSIWPEPFGRIAIEGMAAGRPVIGSRIGGIAENISEESGILVEAGNVKELREAIMSLFKNTSLKNNLKKSGAKTIKERYSMEAVTNKLMKCYGNSSNV